MTVSTLLPIESIFMHLWEQQQHNEYRKGTRAIPEDLSLLWSTDLWSTKRFCPAKHSVDDISSALTWYISCSISSPDPGRKTTAKWTRLCADSTWNIISYTTIRLFFLSGWIKANSVSGQTKDLTIRGTASFARGIDVCGWKYPETKHLPDSPFVTGWNERDLTVREKGHRRVINPPCQMRPFTCAV